MDEPIDLSLVVAGRRILNSWDRLARYCGLRWSGGPPETWAYRYYDALGSQDRDRVDARDVLAAGALHPGLTRADLAFFRDDIHHLEPWLRRLPDVPLGDAYPRVVEAVASLASWDLPITLSLLTKVLHRKRPRLIPLLDRDVLDFYRPIIGQGSITVLWPLLVDAIRADLARQPHAFNYPHGPDCEMNRLNVDLFNAHLERRGVLKLSGVRMVDIVIWMGAQGMDVGE